MRKIAIVLIFLLIAILAVLGFIIYNLYGSSFSTPQPSINLLEVDKTVIGEDQIYYLLFSIKAYQLHSPPFSSNTPKINVVIGNQEYQAEIVKTQIVVNQGKLPNPDLKISIGEEEFINLLNSENFNLALQDSVSAGRTNLEVSAGNTELFTKGYLSLYKEITGKSLTGSFLR